MRVGPGTWNDWASGVIVSSSAVWHCPRIPPYFLAMDPLSDVLRAVRLTGAYFYLVEASAPWSVSAVRATELAPRILPDAEHLIPYHILTQGECLAGREGEALQPM